MPDLTDSMPDSTGSFRNSTDLVLDAELGQVISPRGTKAQEYYGISDSWPPQTEQRAAASCCRFNHSIGSRFGCRVAQIPTRVVARRGAVTVDAV
jgi:hypothetical protein